MITFAEYLALRSNIVEYSAPKKIEGPLMGVDDPKQSDMTEEEEYELLSQRIFNYQRTLKQMEKNGADKRDQAFLYWELQEMMSRQKALRMALRIKHAPPPANAA